MTLAANSGGGGLSLNISQMINSEAGGGIASSTVAAAAVISSLSAAGSASSPLSAVGAELSPPSVVSSASDTMRCVTDTFLNMKLPLVVYYVFTEG